MLTRILICSFEKQLNLERLVLSFAVAIGFDESCCDGGELIDRVEKCFVECVLVELASFEKEY